MGLELTTDRYPPIMSQTRYPLRHAVIISIYSTMCVFQGKNFGGFDCRKNKAFFSVIALLQNTIEIIYFTWSTYL